jgi:hypothetical protein
MLRKPDLNTLLPIIAFGAFLLVAGCASRPKYGASPRHKHGCDCPKWNAIPNGLKDGVRVGLDEGRNNLATVNGHGSDH